MNCRGEFGRRRPGHQVEFCFRSRGWSSRDNGCQGEEVEESGDLHGDMMIARISLVSVDEVSEVGKKRSCLFESQLRYLVVPYIDM